MKRVLMPLLALACAGCLTSEVSRTMEGVPGDGAMAHSITVDIENSGWYLLNCIPLFCGDPHGLDRCSTTLFRDTLTLQTNLDALCRVIEREQGYALGTVFSHEESESYLTFIVVRHGYHTCATLMKTTGDEK